MVEMMIHFVYVSHMKKKAKKKTCKEAAWQGFKFPQGQHFLNYEYVLRVSSSSQKLHSAL